MSVRRLADEQPTSFDFTPENRAWAEREIAKYPPGRQASAVLALLWRAQKQNGYWLPQAHRRAGRCDGRRAVLLDRGRRPRRLLQRADGPDQRGLLRGPDGGE